MTHTPPKSTKFFKGPYTGVGFNLFSQTFGTGPDTRGVQKFIITVTTGNLFGPSPVYRQEFTMNQLYELNDQTIYISNRPRENIREDLPTKFVPIEAEIDGSGGLYIASVPGANQELDVVAEQVANHENDSSEPKNDGEWEWNEENVDDFSDSIFPKNKFAHQKRFVGFRPQNPCHLCFHGMDHRCGFQH